MKIEISIVVRGSERKNPKAKAGSHRRTDLKYMTLSKKKKKKEGRWLARRGKDILAESPRE